MSRSCAVCGIGGVKLCGRCKDRCYCSAECQRADWKTHKTSCCKNICQQPDVLGKSFDPFDPAEMFAEQHLCQFVPLIDGKGAGVVAKPSSRPVRSLCRTLVSQTFGLPPWQQKLIENMLLWKRNFSSFLRRIKPRWGKSKAELLCGYHDPTLNSLQVA